jgi:hypothetical protein
MERRGWRVAGGKSRQVGTEPVQSQASFMYFSSSMLGRKKSRAGSYLNKYRPGENAARDGTCTCYLMLPITRWSR